MNWFLKMLDNVVVISPILIIIATLLLFLLGAVLPIF